MSASRAEVWAEEWVVILDVHCHFVSKGTSLDTESPDDDPSPPTLPGSSSSLSVSSK